MVEDKVETTGPNPGALGLENVQLEIDRIKHKLPSTPGWLSTIGVFSGLIAALVSLLNFGLTSYTYLHRAPKLSTVEGPAIKFTYTPNHRTVTLEWMFSVADFGNQSNIVSNISATVGDAPIGGQASAAPVLAFTDDDFSCLAGEAKVSVPFTVGEGLPTAIACTVTGYISEEQRAELADGNTKLFRLFLTGEKNTSSTLLYCFDFPDDDTNHLRNGDHPVFARFVHPTCD